METCCIDWLYRLQWLRSDTSDFMPGAGMRRLSGRKLQQVLVLRRAGFSACSMAMLLRDLQEPAVVRVLLTQCEQAEDLLTQGTSATLRLNEEELWVAVPPLVESITAALEACSNPANNTWLRDKIVDGSISDDESVKEAEGDYMAELYAISEEDFAEDILGHVRAVKGACVRALARPTASAHPNADARALPAQHVSRAPAMRNSWRPKG